MVLILVAAASVAYLTIKLLYRIFFGKHEVLDTGNEEGWFGKGIKGESQEDNSIRPFQVQVPDEVLADLKERLQKTRFEDSLEDVKFQYGFSSSYLRQVVDYWKTEYNWRKQEDEINKFSHFKTCIEGMDVHFVHVKPTRTVDMKVIPILIVHGWPGSFLEFYKLIPLLTTPTPGQDFVFEVICPSIPGYGFSDAPHHKGFDARAAARVFLVLMERLGHRRFVVQGGDWGSFVCSIMSRYYPSNVLGVHLNMFGSRPQGWDMVKAVVLSYLPFLIPPAEYKHFYPMKEKAAFWMQESGYFHLQTTKPDTVGCAMADSPAGLAAYILEKFATWTDRSGLDLPDGGLTKKFTLDELLTNIMIYWVNNNFTSSARFYKENIGSIVSQIHEKLPVLVPCGFALFPQELAGVPRCLLSSQVKDLVSYTIMPRGGHFAAFEEPLLLAQDIIQFVATIHKRA